MVDVQDILNSTSNSIIAIDKGGTIIYCNKTLADFLELSEGQILGRHVLEFFPETGILEVLEDGKSQLGRRLKLKDGTYITNRDPIKVNGEIVGAIAVFHDVTNLQVLINELHSENERVRELQERLQVILELSSDGIIAVNRNNTITMVNQAFAGLIGKNAEDLMGRNVYDCYDNPIFPLVMETGEPEYGYVAGLNGREIIANRVPIKKGDQIIGALGIVAFKDVDDLYALAQKVNSLREELDYYKLELAKARKEKFSFEQIIGEAPSIRTLKHTIRRVAKTNSTVLIRGESGTGKELFAHSLHLESKRFAGPFVKVNCAAIPENLLESELFGYSDGAFTGAKKGGQVGKFELAHNGTIFLDEIGDMSPHMQAKLLRVLQDKTIERLGENRPKQVDVRVVAATNRNLEELMSNNHFRQDLYYRLSVVVLNVPPLREKKEDIGALVRHFIAKFNKQFGQNVEGVEPQVLDLFHRHSWQGNVRELQNVIERAFNVIDGNMIGLRHLPMYLLEKSSEPRISHSIAEGLPKAIAQLEKEAITEALKITDGNRNQAAALLNISRSSLFNKIKQYKVKN
ncbi:MAG: sigma 54-interacting transcriptional regulator [Bacillota bacterium]